MTADAVPTGGNPMAKLAKALRMSPALRDQLWRDPQGTMRRFGTGIPPDVTFDLVRGDDGRAYFTSAIPRERLAEHAHHAMKRCPVAMVSGAELMADPVNVLAKVGIRVPEDVVVTWDDDPTGYLRFTMVLDEGEESA